MTSLLVSVCGFSFALCFFPHRAVVLLCGCHHSSSSLRRNPMSCEPWRVVRNMSIQDCFAAVKCRLSTSITPEKKMPRDTKRWSAVDVTLGEGSEEVGFCNPSSRLPTADATADREEEEDERRFVAHQLRKPTAQRAM